MTAEQYAVYLNTPYKAHLLMTTDDKQYAERTEMLLEEMREKGFLAHGTAVNITMETVTER